MKTIFTILLITVFTSPMALAAERIKVFKSQKGKALKRIKHEFLLGGANGTSVKMTDGNSSINLRGHYRYSFNGRLQFEGQFIHSSSTGTNGSIFGGGAIYNFGKSRTGNRFFAGGGVLVYSGDFNSDTVVYASAGKRYSLSRHLSLTPYGEILLPSDNDTKASFDFYPFSISLLF